MYSNTPSKPPKPNPLSALFRRKRQTPVSTVPPQTTPSTESSGPEDSLDRKRTKARYIEANKILQNVAKDYGHQWRNLNFDELSGDLENVSGSQFKNKIDMVLESYKNKLNNYTALGKCGHAIQCCFTAFSPLAKNMVTIAKEGCAVILHYLTYV